MSSAVQNEGMVESKPCRTRRALMDTDEPAGMLNVPVLRDSGKHTRGALFDFGADQLRTFQDNHLEVRDNPWAKFRAFD